MQTSLIRYSFVDIISQWRDDWKSGSVVVHLLWTDPGLCASCCKKWGLATTDECSCGKWQTVLCIVSSCPQTKLAGGLQWLHSADDVAVQWSTLTVCGLWVQTTATAAC